MTKVSNITNSRGNVVKNQFIISEGSKKTFQSYDSTIAEIKHSSTSKPIITLDEYYWNYSVTTSRYRNIFLNENTQDTQSKIDSGEYKLANLN